VCLRFIFLFEILFNGIICEHFFRLIKQIMEIGFFYSINILRQKRIIFLKELNRTSKRKILRMSSLLMNKNVY